MNFRDLAIITSKKTYGENSLLLTFLTENHGLVKALIRSNSKNKLYLNLANLIQLEFRQLEGRKFGNAKVELIKPLDITLIDNHLTLMIIQLCCALITETLPENHPEAEIFRLVTHFLNSLTNTNPLKELILLQLKYLSLNGFAIDHTKCALTEQMDQLAYLSPKTGRAISANAAQGYEEYLFRMPRFFKEDYSPEAIVEIIEILNYYIHKFLYKEQNLRPFKSSIYHFYADNLLAYLKKITTYC